MSGLARMLVRRGYHVTGSDMSDSPVMARLAAEGIPVHVGHDAENVGSADLVIITAAAPTSNPELVSARERGIPVVKRAAVLGLLCRSRLCIAVAGTHGKSTTSGMLAFSLDRAGLAPSFAVGADVTQLGTNARSGDGPYFVAEADEYDYSFLWLKPDVAVVTNIEHDHPDLFLRLEDVEEAYDSFVSGIKPDGTLVISADDPGCRTLLRRHRQLPANVCTFGFSDSADWRIERVSGRDHFHQPGGGTLRTRLRIPGLHNRLNAAACLAAAGAAGIEPSRLLPGLETFSGVGRRFEVKGQAAGVTVIEDYAHHPTEIRATITAARERFPAARIIAVFQPHTYSRTRALLDDFAHALSLADRVVLVPIYAARESDDLGVSASDIAERVEDTVVTSVDTLDAAAAMAVAHARRGDVILVIGAGDVWKVSSSAVMGLHQRSATA
jgi:UDP-N-acetylmuramate--alanine ligase